MNVSPLRGPQAAAHLPPTSSLVGNARVSPQVVHSAVLDVDEEGSEGAAAMGSNLIYKTGEVITVHFNRPCMFPTQ